jgi:hypothetical protein
MVPLSGQWWTRVRRTVASLATGLLLLFGGSRPASAQAMDLPIETQIPIFLKLLTFDRNLETRAGAELVVAILFQGGNRESLIVRRQAEAELKKAAQAFEGLIIRIVVIDVEAESDLARRLQDDGVDAIYVSPLRAVDIREILKVTRAARVRSFSGVTRFVNQGVAMGVTMRGDLPQILVNLAAAREEGADYPAQVLKLARLVE